MSRNRNQRERRNVTYDRNFAYPRQIHYQGQIEDVNFILQKTLSSSTNENANLKSSIEESSSDTITLARHLYIMPKEVLRQIFEEVSTKLNNTKFAVCPNYASVKIRGDFKITWCCTYDLKWPQKMQFKRTGPTKKKACHEAALTALLWLKEVDQITEDGKPILHKTKKDKDVNEIKQYTFDGMSKKLVNGRNLILKPKHHHNKERNKTEWSSNYCLKWPEIEKVANSYSKPEAPLSAYLWLKNNPMMMQAGNLFIDRKHQPVHLTINSSIIRKMKSIIKESHYAAFQKLDEDMYEVQSLAGSEEIVKKGSKQRYLGQNKYLAKERMVLPITSYKNQIMNLVKNNRVIIIKGEPGCGKSTRVPQYVLESWIKETESPTEVYRVAVTQPRRIAAISLAEHVSLERDEECGHVVGYQIRLNSNFNKSTGRILYCTTGILLRYLQSDCSLESFPCIVLDEVHEREANTDLLIALLKKSLSLNPKLKLIIMSATIDMDLFTSYFDGAPVLSIDGFTFPVQSYFIDDLPTNITLSRTRKMCETTFPTVIHEDIVKIIMYIHKAKKEGTILCFLPGWDDIYRIQALIPLKESLMVLCLHSRLQDSEQWKIFCPAPAGIRKVILSTNISETSVTIDDVVYIVDTGMHKESRFDADQGVVCLDNQWISQASMIQRKGRAGRVQSGESFHLYTKSKYDSLAKFTDPEILKIPLTKIVLDSKAFYGCEDTFQFMASLPTAPKFETIENAIDELYILDLLDDRSKLTTIGKILAHFQLNPKLAKALLNGVVFKCVTPIVDIVTMFSSETDIFNGVLSEKHLIRQLKSMTGFESSDHLSLMLIFENWIKLMEEWDEDRAQDFCYKSNLNHYNLLTLLDLRRIHFGYLENGLQNALELSDEYSKNSELVSSVLFSGLGNVLQVKRGKSKIELNTLKNFEAALTAESINYRKKEFPNNFLVYISEIRSNLRKINTIRECGDVSPLSVLLFSSLDLTVNQFNSDEFTIGLKGTSLNFLCTYETADIIIQCKRAINSMYHHRLSTLTQKIQFDQEINNIWDKMLYLINEMLYML